MVGCMVALKKGNINKVIEEVKHLDGDCCMIYTQSPTRPSLNTSIENIQEKDIMYKNFEVVVHAPYSINLATTKQELADFSTDILEHECRKAEKIGAKYIVIHSGNALKLAREDAMDLVVERLKTVLERINGLSGVTILLETMAGKGTELGSTLEEIKYMVDGVNSKQVGICLDTCHLHDSGYTLDNELVKQLEDLSLLDKVYCLHVNGSENVKGSKKDRHVGIFNPLNKLDKDVIYAFTKIFRALGVLCILEKPLEYIGTEIEFLKYHTGFDENYDK